MPWDLSARPMEEKDFPACASLLEGRLAYSDRLIAELPRAWQKLLRDQAMNASVFEDRGDAGQPAILGFGLSVFVSDAWAAAARNSQEPYLTDRTLRGELDGPTSPILRPADLAVRSDEALNVLILHYCEVAGLAPEIANLLRYQAMQDFLTIHRGYRIKEVLQELWDEIDPEFLLEGWGRVRTDYHSYFEDRGGALPPMGRRPYLIGLSRKEAAKEPGNLIAPLFAFTPAVLGFTPAEKRVIRQALQGSTDQELAQGLGIALPTVKSHWRSIYNRVSEAGTHLLDGADAAPSEPAQTRGKEKRRRLLEYVRRHPEELCPLDPR